MRLCVPGAKVLQLFSELAPLYLVFLSSSDCKCLSFLNSDLHLIYLLSIKETVFHSFHFISFLLQLISTQLFVFEVFSTFLWAAGTAYGGGVDGWSTISDGDSSEISKRLEVKVKWSKKTPSAAQRGSPSLMMIWGLLALCPAFWSTCTPWSTAHLP